MRCKSSAQVPYLPAYLPTYHSGPHKTSQDITVSQDCQTQKPLASCGKNRTWNSTSSTPFPIPIRGKFASSGVGETRVTRADRSACGSPSRSPRSTWRPGAPMLRPKRRSTGQRRTGTCTVRPGMDPFLQTVYVRYSIIEWASSTL